LLANTAESITGKEKPNVHNTQLVLVQYGKGERITHVSVHLFDEAGWNSAKEYCEKVNNTLNFSGGEWAHANIVHENVIEKVEKPLQMAMILDLDDSSVQEIIRNIDKQKLALALKSVDNAILEKIKKNMTKRAFKMLEEDMECMGPVRLLDVMYAQKKFLDIFSGSYRPVSFLRPGWNCNCKSKGG